MDPQMQYAMERWSAMRNRDISIPQSPEAVANRVYLDQWRLNNPTLSLPPTDILMRQMMVESMMKPNAVGAPDYRGEQARGLMQTKPSSGYDMMNKGRTSSNENLFFPDAEGSIRVGTQYMDYLKNRYGGDWKEMLQRYRLGAGAYRKGARDPLYVTEIYDVDSTVGEFDPEGKGYDYVTAKARNMKPDKRGHYYSLDAQTGMVLKGRGHHTWDLMIAEENRLGNKIVKRNGRYYSVPKGRR